MTTFLNKLKPIFLLVSFGIFSVFVSFLFKSDQVNNQDIKEISVEENAQEDSDPEGVKAQIVDSDTSQQVVLAAADGDSEFCKDLVPIITTVSTCTRSGAGTQDYKEGGTPHGDYVSKDAKVWITKVRVPVTALSGSPTVKNSNREPKNEDLLVKPVGELYDDDTVNINLPPGTQINDVLSYVKKKAYGVKYLLGFTQTFSTPNEEGSLGVDKYKSNYCTYCNNEDNTNPSKTNSSATFLNNIKYRYPGEISMVDSSQMADTCTNAAIVDTLPEDQFTCHTSYFKIATTLIASITTEKFNICNTVEKDAEGNVIEDHNGECVRVEDIMIQVSSIFGSDKNCDENGYCTNAYMTNTITSAKDPISASTYETTSPDKVMYETTCDAIIEGYGPTTVKCVWDFSYIYKEKTISAFNNNPGETLINNTVYNKYLKDWISKDTRKVFNMF